MRVVHLSAEKTWRGGEQQIAYLIQEHQQLNVEQLVVCRKNSAFESYCIKNNIPYKSLGFKNQFDLNSSLQLKRIAKEFKADIIHIHSSHAHAIAVWAYYLGNKTNLVLSRKVDFRISQNFLSKLKYNCPAIKKIICVSEVIKEMMQADVADKNKCLTIYDGIDTSKYKTKGNKLRTEFNITNDVSLVGSTAALADHKDYPTLLKAIKEIGNALNAHYFFIGDGPLRNEIQELVVQNQLEDKITFTGFRTDIDELLPELDVFVLSSKTEGLGSSILDAYACKVPVVCTNAGGIPEIVEQEQTGLLSTVGDAKALAKNIIRIMQDVELRNRIVEQASERVKQFDKKIMAEKTLEVYKEIISS
jgi:glycosyltransferase involved in cell wall biosynthesis